MQIREKELLVTTNESGNIRSGIDSSHIIIECRAKTGDMYAIPYYSNVENVWYLRVKNWDDETLIKKEVSLVVYYKKVQTA